MARSPRQGRFVVHLSCGTVRGEHPLFTQDCPCDPVVQRPGVLGRLVDLCAVCGHGLAWSGSSFSLLVCASCHDVDKALRSAVGHPVLPVWRVAPLNAFCEEDGTRIPYRPLGTDLWPVAADLPGHGRGVVLRLAQGLEEDELPLELWQLLHPESRATSLAAYRDLLRGSLPERVERALREEPGRRTVDPQVRTTSPAPRHRARRGQR